MGPMVQAALDTVDSLKINKRNAPDLSTVRLEKTPFTNNRALCVATEVHLATE